jgi:hypothetical protein
MTATTRRQPRAASPFRVVELTQHWRLINGRWYRDAVVDVDGETRLYSLPDVAA